MGRGRWIALLGRKHLPTRIEQFLGTRSASWSRFAATPFLIGILTLLIFYPLAYLPLSDALLAWNTSLEISSSYVRSLPTLWWIAFFAAFGLGAEWMSASLPRETECGGFGRLWPGRPNWSRWIYLPLFLSCYGFCLRLVLVIRGFIGYYWKTDEVLARYRWGEIPDWKTIEDFVPLTLCVAVFALIKCGLDPAPRLRERMQLSVVLLVVLLAGAAVPMASPWQALPMPVPKRLIVDDPRDWRIWATPSDSGSSLGREQLVEIFWSTHDDSGEDISGRLAQGAITKPWPGEHVDPARNLCRLPGGIFSAATGIPLHLSARPPRATFPGQVLEIPLSESEVRVFSVENGRLVAQPTESCVDDVVLVSDWIVLKLDFDSEARSALRIIDHLRSKGVRRVSIACVPAFWQQRPEAPLRLLPLDSTVTTWSPRPVSRESRARFRRAIAIRTLTDGSGQRIQRAESRMRLHAIQDSRLWRLQGADTIASRTVVRVPRRWGDLEQDLQLLVDTISRAWVGGAREIDVVLAEQPFGSSGGENQVRPSHDAADSSRHAAEKSN